MAEIMTLVIFALLLVLTALTLARQQQIHELQAQVNELGEQLAAAVPPGTDRQQIEDIFRELALAKRNMAALEAAQARVAELEERVKQDDRLKEALGTVRNPGAPDVAQKVAERLELADLVLKTTSKDGDQVRDPAVIAEMLRHAKDADANWANLRGQVAHLQQAMRASGKGTQYPPCWADDTTGKPEYIFDISIMSAGIVIKDNAIPHRAAEQARLPVQAVEFGQILSRNAFLGETSALLNWSKHQDPECRFFVRLFDLTGDAEKAIFKRGLTTVEASFYKFLMESRAEAPR